jgi:hypothetical protein
MNSLPLFGDGLRYRRSQFSSPIVIKDAEQDGAINSV